MDKPEVRYISMAGVVHVLRCYLEQYQIPDREYLSVNICKRCELDIKDTAQAAVRHDMYEDGLAVFMGMCVNRNIPPKDCIICKGKNSAL